MNKLDKVHESKERIQNCNVVSILLFDKCSTDKENARGNLDVFLWQHT